MNDDPRIVHVASELSVPLGPEAENDGNREYIIDVIAAVDYANEMCDRDFAAGVKAARDAVDALPWKVAVSFGPIDCNQSCEHGPCSCSGVMRPEAWTTGPDDALAAIDGVEKP